MIRKIITYPDPILKKVASSVEAVDDEILTLLDDMVETMYAGEGVGLAAPQVAASLRIITIDVSAAQEETPGLLKLINPEIISRDGEIEWDEGCLSVPDFRMMMKRSKNIVVRHMDETGKEKEMSCEGLLAIAIQHEIDHLDGKLIIDDASRLKREMYLKRMKRKEKEKSDLPL